MDFRHADNPVPFSRDSEDLQGEIRRWQQLYSDLRGERDRLLEVTYKLLAALAPFAALWHESLEDRASGDESPVYALNEKEITVGDIRRAKETLEKAVGL